MTTIAYKDGIIAADTQVTDGAFICGRVSKIERLEDGRIAASSGNIFYGQQFIDWLNGKIEKPVFDQDFNAIVISQNGSAVEYEKSLVPVKATMPWTAGTGGKFAFAIMHNGGTAEEAVKVACELDIYSSAPIEVVKI